MDKYMLFWALMILCFFLLEATTISLIGLWFAVGSIAGLILSALGFSFIVQVMVAIVISVISLLAFYPYLKTKITVKKTNVDAIIGKNAMLIEPILFNSYGKVSLNGVIWTAMSDSIIEETDIPVKIIAIDGNKLIVKSITNSRNKSE